MKLFVNGMRVYKRFLLRNPQAKSVVHFGNKVISCKYPAPSWTSGLGTDFISIRLKSPWETCTAAEDGESAPEVKDMFELDMHFYFRTHLDRVKDKDEVKAIASAVEQVTMDLLIEVSNVWRLRTETLSSYFCQMHVLTAQRIPHFATSTRFDLMRLYRKPDGGLVLDGRMHVYVDLAPLQLPWDIIFQDTALIIEVSTENDESYSSSFLPVHNSYPRYDWVPIV